MRLEAGTRLGPYEVLSLIGAGGMGEVYRGRDTRLDRPVAVKVLAPGLASDSHVRTRFTREAKAVSALNHPHICGLYDLGRERDIDYLVLELLDGETLDARLQRGALPLPDVLRFGIEIADALAAAHRQGIIHRDLKPANVLITKGGTKLLDFGLAKTVEPIGVTADRLTAPPDTATGLGTIVGTLQYMAPEQVTGGPVDTRTDIFALGAILHEMATGRRAFEAESSAGLIAKILTSPVPAASTLATGLPSAFDHLVLACLAKEPGERWETAHDLKLQLQWIQTERSRTGGSAAVPAVALRRAWLPWSLAALAAGLFALTAFLRPSPPASLGHVPARLELTLPPDVRFVDSFDRAEISPDGRRVVISASVKGRQQLFIRDLASSQAVARSGTEDGLSPFWSPDSQSIGFFALNKLKRIAVSGGPATLIADAKDWTRARGGATWAPGVIVFPSADGSLLQVVDTGGTPSVVATLPVVAGKRGFSWPRFLPDGRRFLVTAVGEPALYVASLDAAGTQRLPQEGSRAVYAAGLLLYLRGDSAFARAFDATQMKFTGGETLVAERAWHVSAADTGTMLYRGGHIASRLAWFDRRGQLLRVVGEPSDYYQLTLSPRGTRATLVRPGTQGVREDLWDMDLSSGILSRLTTSDAPDSDPSWSPDERRVAFTSSRSGSVSGVYVKDVVTGVEAPLVVLEDPVNLDQWTPDGRFVIFRKQGRTIWSAAVDGDRTPRLLATTPYITDELRVSTDGRWVAYNANESGRWEVYIATFPEFAGKRQISSGGGVQPQWRRDGRELFYLATDGSLMSVRVNTSRGLEVSPPSALFATHFEPHPHVGQYAATADGARFLGLDRGAGERASLTLLLNGTTPADWATAR